MGEDGEGKKNEDNVYVVQITVLIVLKQLILKNKLVNITTNCCVGAIYCASKYVKIIINL